MRNHYVLFLLLTTLTSAWAQNYPSQEVFGKNRIQYRQYEWRYVRTSNFEIYFHQNGGPLANLAAQYAESEFDRITELLGYTPYNRVKIFLYNTGADLAQSNIGIATAGNFSTRDADLAKSRIEIAFTGDQISFRRQLIREVAQLFVYDMLYGGSLKDALQSSLLLSLPDWFMPGIAAYIADGWSADLDDYARDMALNRPAKKPSTLTGHEAELAGHSIWNFIAQRYGRDNISNILNLTRIIRNEQSSIASTLGVPYSRFLRDWRDYYAGQARNVVQAYAGGADDFRLDLGNVDGQLPVQVSSVKISPDKQYVAFATLFDGTYRVEVVNTASRKRTTVEKGGYRLDGRPYSPRQVLVAWLRSGDLVVSAERNGEPVMSQYGDMEKGGRLKTRQRLNGLTQVVSMATAEGAGLLLSADRRGQNDVFMYNVARNTFQQYTNDLYDDLNPVPVGRSPSQIAYASNRLLDTLGADKGSYRSVRDRLSLFTQEGGARATYATRLTDSLQTVGVPVAATDGSVYFLSDASGVRNLYRLDSASTQPRAVTNLPYGIIQADYLPANGAFAYTVQQNGQIYLGYRSRLDATSALVLPPTQRATTQGLTLRPMGSDATRPRSVATPADTTSRPAVAGLPATTTAVPADTTRPAATVAGAGLEPGEVDVDNYQFDPDVVRAVEARQRTAVAGGPATNALSPIRVRRRENVTIRGPFEYQGLFTVGDQESVFRVDPVRGFGFQGAVTLNDLLENHMVRAGAFITPTLRNTNLFAEYHYLRNRIDYGMRVDRQTLFIEPGSGLSQKYRYNRVAVSASYPISVTSRFTLAPFYAITRAITVDETINLDDRVSDYAGLRGEFVFDNTQRTNTGLLEGTRLKIRAEQYAGLRSQNESFNRITLDIRHTQRIHRDLALAVRLSYGQSGGAAPKTSSLGGMENWVGAQKEPTATNPLLIPNPFTQTPSNDYRDVFFLDFVGPLRGFRQGKLNGTSHMLFNAELQLPLVRYLYRGVITSNFLRNLQVVAFTDIGTAWTGSGPFNRQNSLNTVTIGGDNLPFRARVTNFKNPFLLGYGLGARTMLLGYYVKFDYAWGVDNNVTNRAIPYITLGYDF